MFSGDMEDLKKTQIEFVEMKTMTEMKNTLDRTNYRLDIAEKPGANLKTWQSKLYTMNADRNKSGGTKGTEHQ